MAVSMSKSSIKDILMCAVCLEDVKEPRMLVCHHSFCASCLRSIELTGAGSQQKLQCPNCRKYTNVPKGIVNNLPMDYRLNELSEIYSQSAELAVSQSEENKETKSVECEVKKSVVNEASQTAEPDTSHSVQLIVCIACTGPTNKKEMVDYYYCNNCHDYLCVLCSVAHKETPLFKDHDLISLLGKHEHRELCEDHSMKSKDYHCDECKELVCSVCVTNNHREHTVRPFELYDEICRDKIAKQSMQLSNVFHVPVSLRVGLFTGDVIDPLMTCLDLTTEEITMKISEVANSITKDIERQKLDLTAVIEKQHSTIQKIHTAHILEKCCKRLRESKDPGFLLNEHHTLSEEVDSLLDEYGNEEIPELTLESDLFDGFSIETQRVSIGSLSTKKLKEYISEHRLADNRND